MMAIKLVYLIVATSFGFLPLIARADSPIAERSAYRAPLTGDLFRLIQDRGSEFRIHVRTPEGLVSFLLRKVTRDSEIKYFENGSKVSRPGRWILPRLYRGYLLDTRSRAIRSVALDILKRRARFQFFGPLRSRPYVLTVPVLGGRLASVGTLRHRPASLPLKCGAVSIGSVQTSAQSDTFPVTPLYRPRLTLELSTDADYEYYRLFGLETVAEIQSILNMVAGLFSTELGINLKIKGHHVFTSPNTAVYDTTSPFSLLQEFQEVSSARRQLPRADLYHLFTGKNLDSGIVGFSYVGQVCVSNGQFSYGLTQRYLESVQAIITAHEFGHSLGAGHPEDTLGGDTPTSLMSGIVRPSNTQFSGFSLGEIRDFVEGNKDCLGR